MQFEIDRVPTAAMPPARFRAEHYAAERPLLIRGVALPSRRDLTVERFRAAFLPGATRHPGWYDAPYDPTPPHGFEVPAVARSFMEDPGVAIRPLPVRVWGQPRGHWTPFHYDGNSLHVLNLQLRGRKRWTLVSPNTPIDAVPFQQATTVDRSFAPDPARHEFCVVDTEPGDLLFVPRYWAHGVLSLAEVNLNLNWVWTANMPADSVVARREREMLALRRAFPVLERVSGDALAGYAGDERLIDVYTVGVSRRAMARRLWLELRSAPRALRAARRLLAHGQVIADNNFRFDPASNDPPDEAAPIRRRPTELTDEDAVTGDYPVEGAEPTSREDPAADESAHVRVLAS